VTTPPTQAVGVSAFYRRTVQAWLDLSLTIKGMIVISIPLACIFCSVIALYVFQQQRTNLDLWIGRAFQAGSRIQTVLTLLSDAERETRGFLLTGDPKYLAGYEQAQSRLPGNLVALRTALADSPAQLERIGRVESLSRQVLARMRSLISQPRSSVLGDWLEQDLLLRDSIQREFAAMRADESMLWITRVATEKTLRKNLSITLYVASLLSLVAGCFAMVLFTTGIVRRAQLLRVNAERLARGETLLDLRPATDEIGRLAEALARSSLLLDQQKIELRTSSVLLAERSERLKLALRTAKIAVWEMDQSSGRIRYEDKDEFIDSTSYPADLLPSSIDEFLNTIDPVERADVQHGFAKALMNDMDFHRECRFVSTDHSVRWASLTARRYSLGQTSARVLGVIMDVTARKQSEETVLQQGKELAKSEQDLREQTRILQCVLDSMGDGVVVADRNGRFLLFNPAAEKLLGTGAMEGKPDDWAEHYGVFSADLTPYAPSEVPLARALRGISVDEEDLFIRNATLSEGAWISATARPLKSEDADIWGGVVVLRDITERMHTNQVLCAAKEEAEKANRAKSEFLSRMSHELRTPLNSILGFSQILRMHDLTDRSKECVEHVLKGGKHLLRLIDEVLDIARIEAGRLSLSSEPVLVSDAVHQVFDMIRPLANARNLTLTFDRPQTCQQHILADRHRLHQVLLNLLSNAVKYNRDGGQVEVFSGITAAGSLRISVRDTGAGISKADQQRLFAPFERLAASQSDVQGTGLGLALSKRLMEAMGGQIGVTSLPGDGSTFWIELPRAEAPENHAGQREQLRVAETKRLRETRTVMYIEDNLSNIRLMDHIVSYRPHIKLIPAMHGRLGLELVRDLGPDLILLDLHLPDLSGEEVLKRLKADPQTSRIPVIMISADATPGQVSRLLKAGIAAYLTKPVNVEELLKAFDDHLVKPDEQPALQEER
jgi:signal transduction histidine kinase/CHASE3 domain sensor protein/ActR/RegA family two-component response regulator